MKKLDGYKNLWGCHSTTPTDKMIYTTPNVQNDYKSITERFRTDGIFRKIVTLPVTEALRAGHEVKSVKNGQLVDASPEIGLALSLWEEENEVYSVVNEALIYARQYGGSIIIINTKETSFNQLKRPLDYTKELEFTGFTAVPRCYVSVDFNDTRTSIKAYHHNGVEYHPSRIIHVNGTMCTKHERFSNGGFSYSVLNFTEAALKTDGILFSGIETLIGDMGAKTMQIDGLHELLLEDSEQLVLKRIMSLAHAQATNGVTAIDTTEKIERATINFGNIPEVIVATRANVAANANIPYTLLYGKQGAHLKATGNNEFTIFYNEVRSMQQSLVKPILKQIHKVYLATPDAIQTDEKLYISFLPLVVHDPVQNSVAFFNATNGVANLVRDGVIHAEEARAAFASLDNYEMIQVDSSYDEDLRKQREQLANASTNKGQVPSVMGSNTGLGVGEV